jgi:hypothetical protein
VREDLQAGDIHAVRGVYLQKVLRPVKKGRVLD